MIFKLYIYKKIIFYLLSYQFWHIYVPLNTYICPSAELNMVSTFEFVHSSESSSLGDAVVVGFGPLGIPPLFDVFVPYSA